LAQKAKPPAHAFIVQRHGKASTGFFGDFAGTDGADSWDKPAC
jgi:hypothetical protein